MAKERHPIAFLVGAAVGGAIGGLYGLLNAPRPGAETWARLTERWHDVEERTAQGIARVDNDLRDRLSSDQASGERVTVSVTIDGPARS
jgi:gas vesicle protein